MLPSTGLFKTIACPFYDAGSCFRPFCHYKHARKDEPSISIVDPIFIAQLKPSIQLLETPVVYKPTPKILLASSTAPDSPEPAQKKQRLEYIPTPKPASQNHIENRDRDRPKSNDFRTAEYKPTNAVRQEQKIHQPNDDLEFSLDECLDELDAIADMLSGETNGEEANLEEPRIVYVPSEIPKEDVVEAKAKSTSKENAEELTKNGKSKSSEKRSSSSSRSSSTHREHGSSSKSRDSTHKSSRSISSKDKDKDRSKKDKDRDRVKESTSSSRSSKSSSSQRHSSSSSSSKSKNDSTKSSSKSSSDPSSRSHHTSTSSKTPDRKSSSKSSTSKSTSSSRSDSSSKTTTKPTPVSETPSFVELTMPSPSSLFDSESDEDDVMAQCRMIFDEYKTKPTAAPAATATSEKVTTDETETQYGTNNKYDDAARKKRVAYDGAENARPVSGAPTTLAKNYSHMAMESVFKRQEVVRIQLQKMEEKKAADAAANEKRLFDLESDRMAKAKQALNRNNRPPPPSMPIANTFQQPVALAPKRFGAITPASNILAMQRAKLKIDQIRAAKQPTISRTVSRAVGRVAHVTSVTAEDLKPSPPVLEPKSTKISFNIRMQYYTLMVKHCQTIYDDCNDAWERAQTVELGVFNKCSTPVIYKKSATLAINQLRKEAIEAGNVSTEKNKTVSHDVILAGKLGQNTSWSVNKKLKSSVGSHTNPLDTLSGSKVYDLIFELRLTDEQLHENGYPRPGDRPGWAKVHQTRNSAQPNNDNDRYCQRCGKIFNISHYDEDCVDQCNYHAKRPGYCRGHVDHLHRCCQQPAGSPGCMYGDYHVTEKANANRLTGYVKTIAKDEAYRPNRSDVFALDCEMCYTTNGLDLTRVTVVDFSQKTVYDALVKPDYKVVDYNTQFSGITEEMLRNETRTLRDVQAVLLSMFHSRTVLIGHSLDSDLKALKILHDVVVDTSVLYPHKMGLPMKRALKTLCIENLKRIIQESDAGHDSAEDAEVCIQLLRHFLENKITSSIT